MSDDEFDDSFFADDTFLKEVDSLTASASTTAPVRPTDPTPSVAEPYWRAVSAKPGSTSIRPVVAGSFLNGYSKSTSAALSDQHKSVRIPFPPLSDRPPANGPDNAKRPVSPLSKRSANSAFSRSTSSNQLQTHLNFRRDVQYTKGKRWDRTAFAESGRRRDAEKRKGAKGKRKGKAVAKRPWDGEDDEMLDDDEEDEEENYEDDVAWSKVVPGPKPFVDPNKPYDPQRHLPMPSAVDTYLYPINHPKRDYQYEIVQACFKDNCLVALPTGLGKTFVAGVVMLNFYRWFPNGKIVFLAPTRPLVQQQIEACQLTCGIPSKEAAVITGQSLPAKKRAAMWESRRVFYCTPQCLEVDLQRKHVDPKDIVLVVFDEAHKASGSYAYTTILAYLTAHTPYFRVLALTATPGADVPRVQAVVDALHISRIEIREAEAPDIRKYMNEKRTERHVLAPSAMIESFRDRWAALMMPYIQNLVKVEILNERALDAKRLRVFAITSKRMELSRSGKGKGQQWAYGSLAMLEKMVRAMTLLLEFSLGMFHTVLSEIAGNVTAEGKSGKTKAGSNQVSRNMEFQRLLRDVEQESNSIRVGLKGRSKPDKHPKMGKTLELLLGHFTQAEEEERTLGEKNNTRAMVFCSFRECVLEIVEMINEHSPTLKATKFVGQSAGKKAGDKGFNQKEQKQTIADFKEGKYNVLVATSIGEEGLDIGEVDFVVLYDMPKTSIKLLQRVGRTGRKRNGIVHALMAENREDMNWDSAQQTHRDIQEEILHSRNLELFEDVEPLLPKGPFPRCIEQEMEIDPFDPDEGKQGRQQPLQTYREREAEFRKEKAAYKEKHPHRGHEIPEDAVVGFASVKDLMRKAGQKIGSPKKKPSAVAVGKGAQRGHKKGVQRVLSSSESESEDQMDEALSDSIKRPAISRRRQDAEVSEHTAKRSKTIAAPIRKRMSKQAVTGHGSDSGSAEEPDLHSSHPTSERLVPKPFPMAVEAEEIDFLHPQGPVRRRSPVRLLNTPPSSPGDPFDSVPPGLVSAKSRVNLNHPPSPITDESVDAENRAIGNKSKSIAGKEIALTPRTAEAAGFSHIEMADLAWSSDVALTPDQSTTSVLRTDEGRGADGGAQARRRAIGLSRPSQTTSATPSTALAHAKSADQMPPPPMPASVIRSSPLAARDVEATQFPIRRAGRRNPQHERSSARNIANRPPDESPPVEQLRRVRRRIDSSPAQGATDQVPPFDRVERIKRAREFTDLEAEVSGSESEDEDLSDHSTHSDRMFAGDFQPTQAPKGYNQRAAYLAGLSTQAPAAGGPAFPSMQAKRDAFFAKARKPIALSSDVEDGGSENEYELGSFVIGDDEDLGFHSQSQD